MIVVVYISSFFVTGVNISVAKIFKQTIATFAIMEKKCARLTMDLRVLWIVVIKLKQRKPYF